MFIFGDESTRLLASIRARYGDLVVSDAVSRALSAACQEAVPISQETLDVLDIDDDGSKQSMPSAALNRALKIELRRLLQTH